MSEPDETMPVEELTAACSRSAQALRLAILAVEEPRLLGALRAAYVERVGLFEVCARCLAAEGARSERIVALASGRSPDAPLTATEALARVSVAERRLERAVLALGRPLDDGPGRLAALARRQLAATRGLRRGRGLRSATADPTATVPLAAA